MNSHELLFSFELAGDLVLKNRIVRLSPQAYIHLDHTEGDELAFECLLEQLYRRDILYVHLDAFEESMLGALV